MSDVLSEEEIAALFAQSNAEGGGVATDGSIGNELSDQEIDTIGEVANISMGTAATTLFSLVNKKVDISTPVVSLACWNDIVNEYEKPCVLIKISYTKGLNGSNVLVLSEHDVKVITDLMMGGDGTNLDGELGEIHLSAISEAMNQMMGSSATSLSTMLNMMVDISPPSSDLIDLHEAGDGSEIDDFLKETFVKITFKLQIGDLVDSFLMQLYPIPLVKEMCSSVISNMEDDSDSTVNDEAFAQEPAPAPAPEPAAAPQATPQPAPQAAPPPMGAAPMPDMQMQQMAMPQQQVNVQPAQFQPFAGTYPTALQPENIDLIMDVPLEVTVELGRTHKSIQEILDFAPGTILELNKIAGEPIDVLVNGKYVAKGEVVVIEESFGIRITEIMK
ncbi:MAG TPA: flagellar motor switch phosphatase FliY [Lachnospiraceae bacterium]|nr:flagellar motor switch phosphatase FliY [Lachnospiraceae bacterium]